MNDANDGPNSAVIAKMLLNTDYMCNRGPRKSGAALVDKFGIVVLYGSVKPTHVNAPNCLDDGCMIEHNHCVRNIHAEVDAILQAARIGISTEGGVMYTINKPCYNCMQAIIKAGITTVYYLHTVYDEERTQVLENVNGIQVVHVDYNNV